MTQPPPIYFPSLYDRSVSTSPVNNFNIWKNLGVPSKDQTQPQCLTNEKAPWPPGLADISYEPLWFFNTPFKGDYAPRPSHLDEICELEIQIKEMELLTITGDGFDYEKYHFLKAVKDKKMQNIKAELEFSKQKAAS
ncbi:uncharacterized protein C11orf91 homolog [Discoglossus pictus]